MSKLLVNQDDQPEELTVVVGGQIMELKSQSRFQRKITAINDILAWCQAFVRFMAVLLAADATTKEQAAGLAADQHLILQLSKDLGG